MPCLGPGEVRQALGFELLAVGIMIPCTRAWGLFGGWQFGMVSKSHRLVVKHEHVESDGTNRQSPKEVTCISVCAVHVWVCARGCGCVCVRACVRAVSCFALLWRLSVNLAGSCELGKLKIS